LKISLRKKIKIGEKEFLIKKEALSHYKMILNSYGFGEPLNESDLREILNLLGTHPRKKESTLYPSF
jgi:hypothetical protein